MSYKTLETEKYNVAKTVWDWTKKENQNDMYDEFENFEEYFQESMGQEITGEHNQDDASPENEVVILRISGKEICASFNFLKDKISEE